MKMLMKSLSKLSVVTLLLFVAASGAFAANTGKIVGKVTDEKGAPIPGAIVVVMGTQRGASTDLDGKYEIVGVALGTYDVRATAVSYDTVTAHGVKVNPDESTPQNFKLTTGAVKLGEVDINADAILVNKLSTSSEQTMSQKSIEAIPAAKDVQDVLQLQAGFVKQGNNLFLRGGRADEVQYLVDGVPTNNLVGNSGGTLINANSQLAGLYAGTSAGLVGGGTSGLTVSSSAIASVSVQTSGFDADYGNAQSGIVNIITKSGGDSYSASAQFRTDKLQSTNQDEDYTALTFGGPEPITHYLLNDMGISIPGNLSFFLSADADQNNGPYQFSHNVFYNPLQRKLELNGFLGGLFNGLGFWYTDEQNNSFTFDSKFTYSPNATDQISYSYKASVATNWSYSQGYQFFADSTAATAAVSTEHDFFVTHFFSKNTFLKVTLGETENHNGNDVAGLLPQNYSSAENYTQDPVTGFYYLGSSQDWLSSTTDQYSARLDFTSQVHPLHLLKAGFEFYYESLVSTEIENPTWQETDPATGELSNPPFTWRDDQGLYPGYGQYRWNLDNFPNHGAAYIQDNIEFSGLNLHAGLRYDYFDIGKQTLYPDWVQAWNAAVNPPGTVDIMPASWANDVTDGSTFLYYVTHGWFSPRLSIGYPVTDRIVFYFNYGHFLQYPDRDEYFKDPFTSFAGNVVGNPGLLPQETVQYESGFEDQFADNTAFSVHAFYKDIFNYATTVQRELEYVYTNLDYASDRGFDLGLNQSLTGNLQMNVTYTYQVAQGRSSNPLASIFNPQFELPRETRLDYDQTHTANVFVNYRVRPDQEGTFFGLPCFNNYGMSLTFDYGSGFPYTPYVPRFTAQNVYLVNSATLPATATVNYSFYKGFQVLTKMNLLLTLDITNLMNRNNITGNSTALGFNTATGAPYTYGDANPITNVVYPYNSMAYLRPPLVFAAPRQILIGAKFNWE
jgi:outer membrane receptor for ferrienterochelin and colicin